MRPLLLDNERRQGHDIKDSAFRRLAKELAPASIKELAWLSEADQRATLGIDPGAVEEGLAWLIKKARDVGVDQQAAPELMAGKDFLQMGFAPGPEIGRLIQLSSELRDKRGFSREDIIQALFSIRDVTEAMGKLEKLLLTD
jgi:tRNA nucleotidyltransferase (CCA-adding enzyme)